MIIVDSSVWIDILHGQKTPQTLYVWNGLDKGLFAITDKIYCEVLQGIREESVFKMTRHDLLLLTVFNTCGAELAEAAAQHYRAFRKKGITIRSTIDCLTATFCIREGHSLLHNDRDFEPFERSLGLQVIYP